MRHRPKPYRHEAGILLLTPNQTDPAYRKWVNDFCAAMDHVAEPGDPPTSHFVRHDSFHAAQYGETFHAIFMHPDCEHDPRFQQRHDELQCRICPDGEIGILTYVTPSEELP